ncbi:hypothetical protein PVAP13_5KG473000 [Panicum virgatum]|uniref:Uncharacterized protein n=1 Tax=Panicum virgatum TaxID=38727 RepID=A0A8T0SW27_PANVG|nr:hypothetical protein PVAP13_5KG473000 [Panicum virgatum]
MGAVLPSAAMNTNSYTETSPPSPRHCSNARERPKEKHRSCDGSFEDNIYIHAENSFSGMNEATQGASGSVSVRENTTASWWPLQVLFS